MKSKWALRVGLVAVIVATNVSAAAPAAGLALARIRKFIESDATACQYRQRVVAQGEAILRQPPVERVLIGPRLLDKSRTVVCQNSKARSESRSLLKPEADRGGEVKLVPLEAWGMLRQ